MGVVRKYVMVKRRDFNREKNVVGAFTGAATPGPATPAKAEGKGHGDKDTMVCYACGRKGHTKNECWSTEETRAKYRATKGGGKGPGRSQSPANKNGKGKDKGKGKGKGKGKNKSPRPRSQSPATHDVVGVCWLYNRGECTANPCPRGRKHVKWSKEAEARANRGTRAHSPAAAKAAAAGR